MFFSFYLNGCWIFYFWINSWFGSIRNPLSYKYFVFFSKKIRSLALSHVIYPMSFEMIATSFSHNSIPASLSHKPHALIYISIFINHSSLTMRFAIHPHAIISITFLIKHGPSTLFRVILPISSVLSS